MDVSPFDKLKSLTRRRTRLIWNAAQLGAPLSEEDARLAQAMREHPEYADLWGHLDELSDGQIERDGTNPILHVTIHMTIENQLAIGQPPETGQAVEVLMQQGLSRHEAIHRVGTVLAEEIYGVLKDNRPFDESEFTRKLKQLVKPGPVRLHKHRPRGRYR